MNKNAVHKIIILSFLMTFSLSASGMFDFTQDKKLLFDEPQFSNDDTGDLYGVGYSEDTQQEVNSKC